MTFTSTLREAHDKLEEWFPKTFTLTIQDHKVMEDANDKMGPNGRVMPS